MNHTLTNALALLGRVLMAWLFVPAGWSKLMGFSGSVGYAAAMGVPLPEAGIALALVLELGAGLLLLLGFMTRPAALLLALFTLVASVIFHAFWALPAEQVMMQQLLFTKNLAVIGGLLAFAAFGAGGWSLDAGRNRK